MGANLRTKGRKFLLYFLDPLLRRQLKGRYWWCGWRANQEGGGRSGQLTLIIKRSDKLFHGVNEDGEFGGFSIRGGSKGWSEREWTIVHKCGRGSCGAVKDKVLMSLLIRYAHIPFYFRFSFTFPTLPIHPYTPPLRRDRTRSRSHSHDNHTRSIGPTLLI